MKGFDCLVLLREFRLPAQDRGRHALQLFLFALLFRFGVGCCAAPVLISRGFFAAAQFLAPSRFDPLLLQTLEGEALFFVSPCPGLRRERTPHSPL
ncbi:hypothetical protein [Chelativorans xinjiangense]|uniref:hypothetical protein n=1 Tax=Chelativorans xinjiangense TaxID=2681485 RepID=UPI00135B7176|nr:hypothetical protein [Chelativorans xinjiangense]